MKHSLEQTLPQKKAIPKGQFIFQTFNLQGELLVSEVYVANNSIAPGHCAQRWIQSQLIAKGFHCLSDNTRSSRSNPIATVSSWNRICYSTTLTETSTVLSADPQTSSNMDTHNSLGVFLVHHCYCACEISRASIHMTYEQRSKPL